MPGYVSEEDFDGLMHNVTNLTEAVTDLTAVVGWLVEAEVKRMDPDAANPEIEDPEVLLDAMSDIRNSVDELRPPVGDDDA